MKKTIVITGATGGIGSQLSKTLCAEGHQCILLGRNIKKLEKLYDEIIESSATKPALYPIDFGGANIDDYEKFTKVIKENFGKVDQLIHCAAIWKESTSIEHSDLKSWFEVFNVNLHAAYMLSKTCIPLLKESKDAEIIFSDHDIKESKTAHMGAFTISKDAIKSLAGVLNNELNTDNCRISVKVVSVGEIRSPMNVRIYPGIDYSNAKTPKDIVNIFIK